MPTLAEILAGGNVQAQPPSALSKALTYQGPVGDEYDPYQQMNPIDRLKLNMPSNWAPVSEQQAAANKKQNLRDLLSIVPGPGNVIAAEDAVTGMQDAVSQFGQGNYGKGALSTALAALSGVGAVTGLPFGRMAGNAARGASSTAPAFPAWHGSPHDFDEFKLDKIGTGEGAQAYGHGLYFAESPDVAISYRNNLTKGRGEVALDGVPLNDTQAFFKTIDKLEVEGNWPLAKAINEVQSLMRPGEDLQTVLRDRRNWHASSPKMLAAFDELERRAVVKAPPPGRLYHTEIDAEPHQLLDWDKPLSEQGDVGQKALSIFEKMGFTADPGRTLGDIKQIANERYGRGSFKEAEVSTALREAGIPGIRYLDQGSRGADGGTSNFVIFDDQLVKILNKE